jgi:hypothetical protein
MPNTKRYLSRTPRQQPKDGRIVCHNHIRWLPESPLNTNGFRAWVEPLNTDEHEVCPCLWANDIGTHYRMKWMAAAKQE